MEAPNTGDAVEQAVKGLQLTKTEALTLLQAFRQMGAKGTVDPEELRGQAGQYIRDIVQLFAKAYGSSVEVFVADLQAGKVRPEQVLPGFIKALAQSNQKTI